MVLPYAYNITSTCFKLHQQLLKEKIKIIITLTIVTICTSQHYHKRRFIAIILITCKKAAKAKKQKQFWNCKGPMKKFFFKGLPFFSLKKKQIAYVHTISKHY